MNYERLRNELRARFPWLGTDNPAGSGAIRELCDWYDTVTCAAELSSADLVPIADPHNPTPRGIQRLADAIDLAREGREQTETALRNITAMIGWELDEIGLEDDDVIDGAAEHVLDALTEYLDSTEEGQDGNL